MKDPRNRRAVRPYADNRVGLRLRNRVRDAILCGRFGVCFIVFYFDFIHTDLLI